MIIFTNNNKTTHFVKSHCVLNDLFTKEKWFLFSASRCSFDVNAEWLSLNRRFASRESCVVIS